MHYAEAEAYERQGQIKIHDPQLAFPGMAAAGRLAAQCLDMLVPEAKEGVTTKRLDDLARQFVFDHGALPACVFYRGYRHTICTSLNHVVCHGIPGDRVLKDGDIVNIDVTVILDGWHGDTSRMYAIGHNVSRKAQRLMDVTYDAMMRGLAAIRPGATLGDLGHAIQSYAEAERTSVVRARPRLPRCAQRAALRQAGTRRDAEARHDLHRRAHAQRRLAGGEGAERRLDGGDQG
jgi:methionyl aminopeptidase